MLLVGSVASAYRDGIVDTDRETQFLFFVSFLVTFNMRNWSKIYLSDRVSDALVLGGVTWYLIARHHGQVAVLALAVLAASMLVSYERARAEALGFTARGGLMERAERMILLGVGLAFRVVLVPVLWVMLVLTAFTAVQRFVRVWQQAAPSAADRPPPRWRTWRPLASGSDDEPGRWRSRRAEGAEERSWRRRARTRP